MAASITTEVNELTHQYIMHVAVDMFDFRNEDSILRKAIADSAAKLAQVWVEENKTLILQGLNPTAIANLAIADSAKLVRKQFIDPSEDKK